MDIKEPTPDQCSSKAKVYETERKVGYAMWTPQLGGYVGKCVVEMDKEWEDFEDGSQDGGCIDIYLWHNGEFPTPDESPVILHFCDPQQIIDFGESIKKLNDSGRHGKIQGM